MRVTNQKENKKFYKALVAKDESYVGLFYAGVKTTGIFCIATCRARKPKYENVEFFTEVQELLQHGYRPCKICKPTLNGHDTPEYIKNSMDLLEKNPGIKIKDFDLRQEGIQPLRVKRWFKKHFGMTFQAYQRMFRINNAFQELQDGQSVTHSAYDNGYNSLSGFGYSFKRAVGSAPSESLSITRILISRLTTPLGPMFVCATDEGICLLEYTDRRMLETELKDIQKRLNGIILTGENKHIIQLKKEMKEYFEGTIKQFTVSLHTLGTDFQRSVWSILHSIPYGETCSYQEQAIKLNKPKAVRAVASANGHNRIAIVIPCHRVIGKNGKLVGYGGGLERKKWLLNHEKMNVSNA